jgi:hypothetical protein
MIQPLNSPIEVALRVLVLLNAYYPSKVDINRLVLYDYSLLHSSDLGGPESIHPSIPGRTGEMGLKRYLIEQGILILRRADLVDISTDKNGILYSASENAAGFIATLTSGYSIKLKERATWVHDELGESDDSETRDRLAQIFSAWSEEFDSGGG